MIRIIIILEMKPTFATSRSTPSTEIYPIVGQLKSRHTFVAIEFTAIHIDGQRGGMHRCRES